MNRFNKPDYLVSQSLVVVFSFRISGFRTLKLRLIPGLKLDFLGFTYQIPVCLVK